MRVEQYSKELHLYTATKEEMETAMAVRILNSSFIPTFPPFHYHSLQNAKLSADTSEMTKNQVDTEIQVERQHKLILYKQMKSMRSELKEKSAQLQQAEKMIDKLKAKAIKLRAENDSLNRR